MTASKKLKLLVCALVLLVIAGGATVIGVLATRTANLGGGNMKVTYTAVHVNATITGQYKKGSGSYANLKKGSDTTITFAESDKTGSSDKTFDSIGNVTLKASEALTFRYEITNTSSTNSFKITLGSIANFQNITADYTYTVKTSGTEGTVNNVFGSGEASEIPVSANQIICLYVTLTITDADSSASFDGSINFKLTAVE